MGLELLPKSYQAKNITLDQLIVYGITLECRSRNIPTPALFKVLILHHGLTLHKPIYIIPIPIR